MQNVKATAGISITRARQEQQMTQKELAERMGMDQTYISKLEKGKINMTMDTLTALAAAMGCTVDIRLRKTKSVTLQKEKHETL